MLSTTRVSKWGRLPLAFVAAVWFGGAWPTSAVECVWIEAENTAYTNLKPEVKGWGRKEFLSQGTWLNVSIPAGKVGRDLPAEGGFLKYRFTVTRAGRYEVWNRIGYEFVRSPFDWRLDGGTWRRLGPDRLTVDLMELQTWNEVAWLKLGEAQLRPGNHSLEIRLPKTTDAKGKTARVLYASDVLCIYRGVFRPNGKYKPGEDYRTPEDEQAARHVFQVPAVPTGRRAEVELKGLWEVCRNDEQLPGKVEEPIRDFPAPPYWRGIPVPGDKNKLRPDLIFCHRLWFRTRVRVPESLAGRSFFVVFPQNNLNTTVFVNGVYCGFNKNPFARFQIDVTKGVHPGVNEVWVGIRDCYYGFSTNPTNPLKLRKKFNYPSGWWGRGFMDLAYPVWRHPQSGILVTPSFVAAGPVYAADVFCKPSVARKRLAVEVTLTNTRRRSVSGELVCEVINRKTGGVEKTLPPTRFTVGGRGEKRLEIVTGWANPKLWWPDDPNLYDLRTTVHLNDKPVDVCNTTFGFREWSWTGHDFKLNGIPWHGWADCHTAASKEEWLADYRAFHERMMRFWGTSWQGMPPEEALRFFDEHGVVVRRSGILDGEAIGYNALENDPDLKKLYGTAIKKQLLDNWRDQVVAQVEGERNHPSIMIWSLENEFLYINCINLYGRLMDEFEAETTKTWEAVHRVDPTRPAMVDGGGATKAQTLPVHGDHYVVGRPDQYPDLAYAANPTGGGKGRWTWDERRPRFIGEDFYMTGNHPEVAYFEGESAFAGKPRRGVSLWERILQQGYRWAGYGAWQFWLGQNDTDRSQYRDFLPRAVFCRQWDWTFAPGQKVQRTFRVFNDTRFPDPITFSWTLTLNGRKVDSKSRSYDVPPGTSTEVGETLSLPQVQRREEGVLTLTLTVKGREVFRDTKDVSVLRPTPVSTHATTPVARGPRRIAGLPAAKLAVYDPRGDVREFLHARGLAFTAVSDLGTISEAAQVLLIGKDALTAREAGSSRLAALAAGARRVVVLEQMHPLHFQGLPADMDEATNTGFTAFGQDFTHPVLRNLRQKDFFTWGVGKPVYRNAYRKPRRGARSLIQCGDRLRFTGLVEVPVGKGLLLLSQLTVGENLRENPVCQQLLLNLLAYAAAYKLEFRPVAVAVHDTPPLQAALQAMGLQFTTAPDPLTAMQGSQVKTVVASASADDLHALVAHRRQVEAFCSAGGTVILCGLTPAGLADYNRLVGFDHMIRPGKRERVLFPPKRDPLTAGLTTGDIVLYSSKRIFSWRAGNYVVPDMFSYVVDYDEVASFARSPFFAYDNITNGFFSADGWPLIINFPKHADDSPYEVPLTWSKPQTLTEFTWVGNVFYYPQTKVNLLFDGDRKTMLSFSVEPNAEPQTFAIDPPRTAREVTVEIAGWKPVPGKAPNLGIDNIYLKAERSPAFYRRVKPMLNIGGLMRYVVGKGNLVLCNLLFKDHEEVPENAVKKRRILAAILANLKAPFAGGKTIIAGANLVYEPVDLSKQATQYRGRRGWFGDRRFTFADFPTGRQRFAGVPFQVYDFPTSPVPTVLMLAGRRVPNNPPPAIRGIPIHRKADALFFLHTARMDRRRNRRELKANKRFEMLRYVVHYADGKRERIPVYAEIDIDDYHPRRPHALPGAQLAWTKPYAGTDRTAAVYLKQWNNPRPQVEIATLDMEYGPAGRGVPVLLALTTARAAE